jgi:hypothetical protein
MMTTMTVDQAQRFLARHKRAKASNDSPAFVPVEVGNEIVDAVDFYRLLRHQGTSENTAALHTDWAVEEYCARLHTARLTVRRAEEVMA